MKWWDGRQGLSTKWWTEFTCKSSILMVLSKSLFLQHGFHIIYAFHMEARKADWCNNQKLLRRESYKEHLLKHFKNFGGYITLPCSLRYDTRRVLVEQPVNNQIIKH